MCLWGTANPLGEDLGWRSELTSCWRLFDKIGRIESNVQEICMDRRTKKTIKLALQGGGSTAPLPGVCSISSSKTSDFTSRRLAAPAPAP